MQIRHLLTKFFVTLYFTSLANFSGYAIADQVKNSSQEIPDKTIEQTYVVQKGDVLGKVCQKYQPPGMSLKDVMKAFYNINKDAFKNNDPTKLIVGSTLHIPSELVKSPHPEDSATKNPNTQKVAASEKTAESDAVNNSAKPAQARVAAPIKTPAAAVATTSVTTPLQPIEAPVGIPIAPEADKPAAETTSDVKNGSSSQPVTTDLKSVATHKDSSSLITWLKYFGIVAGILFVIGFYLRQRKNLIEARQKEIESLLN